MKKPLFFLGCFGVAVVAELLALQGSSPRLEYAAKPFIILTLIGYYASNPTPSVKILIAMIFCLLGDVLLLFEPMSDIFFKMGLAAFMIGHIFFILGYRQSRIARSGDELIGVQIARLSFPVILAGTGLVVLLYPVLGDLRIPVVSYAAVLTGMVLTAISRYGRTSAPSFWFVFCGAVLFMLSDSLLAIDRFLNPFPQANLSVMITYCAAQFLIAKGLTEAPAGNRQTP